MRKTTARRIAPLLRGQSRALCILCPEELNAPSDLAPISSASASRTLRASSASNERNTGLSQTAQTDPGKNRWAERIHFEARHTFIDHLVVSCVGNGRKRLFAFEYFLRLRVKLSALSDIRYLCSAPNYILKFFMTPF